MSQSVLFRVDASPQIGGGHATRCLSLALELRARGTTVRFAMTEAWPGFEATLAADGIGLDRLTGPVGSRDDAMDVIALARKHAVRNVVVDGYQFKAEYRTRLKSGGLKLLVVDDYGNIGPYRAEHVLNPNIVARGLLYGAGDTATFLLGPQYALLRPPFREHPVGSGPIKPKVQRILVTAGAADPANLTVPLLEILNGLDLRGAEVDVVVGPGFRSPAKIERVARRSRHTTRVHVTPADMAGLMKNADLCLVAAGSTLWELAALGVPAVAMVVADNQTFGARTVAKAGSAIAVDVRRGLPGAAVQKAVSRLLRDYGLRSRMSAAGRHLVDGRGAARVADVLLKGLKS